MDIDTRMKTYRRSSEHSDRDLRVVSAELDEACTALQRVLSAGKRGDVRLAWSKYKALVRAEMDVLCPYQHTTTQFIADAETFLLSEAAYNRPCTFRAALRESLADAKNAAAELHTRSTDLTMQYGEHAIQVFPLGTTLVYPTAIAESVMLGKAVMDEAIIGVFNNEPDAKLHYREALAVAKRAHEQQADFARDKYNSVKGEEDNTGAAIAYAAWQSAEHELTRVRSLIDQVC
jgi:hypothetical protein